MIRETLAPAARRRVEAALLRRKGSGGRPVTSATGDVAMPLAPARPSC
jgi:hypothetical protein